MGAVMLKKTAAFLAISLCILLSSSEGKKIGLASLDEGHKEFNGALNIRLHGCGDSLYPPAELLLVDPWGRMTGYQPNRKTLFSQIPNSTYENESIDDVDSGAPGPVTKIIDVRNPSSGEYVLRIIGVESLKYDLEIRSYDHEMNFSDAKFMNIEIKKDAEHTYTIVYSSEKSTDTKVSSSTIKKDR